jgi:hypothetical protein
VIRVGLARTTASYAGLEAPFGPGKSFPELEPLLGPHAANGSANHVYHAVRSALRGLGLDAERYGTADWNPLGALAPRGARIVLKPNFIRHWNPLPEATIDSVITHGGVVRARRLRVPRQARGSVVLTGLPSTCDWGRITGCGLVIMLASLSTSSDSARPTVTYAPRGVVHPRDIAGNRRALAGSPAERGSARAHPGRNNIWRPAVCPRCVCQGA